MNHHRTKTHTKTSPIYANLKL